MRVREVIVYYVHQNIIAMDINNTNMGISQ